MSFIDQWRNQINDSVATCANLAASTSNINLKYQLMVVGMLWPIRQQIQDFDFEAMAAVHKIIGDRSKHVLQMVQQWEGDQLTVAQSISAHDLQQGELDAALRKMITYFKVFPIFAKELAAHPLVAKSTISPDQTPTKPSITLPRILVSYTQSDGGTLGTEVRERLQSEGISIWADLVDLEGTRDWWKQNTRALDHVDFLVLGMTPALIQSKIIRKIWRYAQQKGVCIYPVMNTKELDFSQLPHWISQLHFYDLNLEWSKLINSLNGECQTPRVPFMVEDLPPDFVERPAIIEQILTHLFDSERQEGIAGVTALYGAGGYGKSTLIRAICHNDDIRQVFDNGILWVTLTENPGDLSRHVINLIEVLSGDRPGFTSLEAATGRLGELLLDRDILLVIDDVWNEAHLRPFLQGGPRCARLITTRHINVLPTEAKKIVASTMEQDEAVALLGSELPYGHIGRMRQLADHLGQWPLLLKLANGTLRDRVYKNRERLSSALNYVDHALAQHGVTAFDIDNPEARDQAVTRTIEMSLELLSEAERSRYNELAIFPEDVNIPLSALEILWQTTGNLDDFDTEELCDNLHELSLLAHLDLTNRYLRLHRVMRNYLLYQQEDNLEALHHQFLEAQFSNLDHWADLPPQEPYMWTYLSYHLIEADRPAELVHLVKDLRYLAAKSYACGVHYTEIDLLAAEAMTSSDKILRLLHRLLSQTSHLLVRCVSMNEIANTLHSRLIHLPELAPMAIEAEPHLPRPLLTAGHTLPDLSDPVLIRTLHSSDAGIMDCAVSADGSTLVSIAKDNSLTVWDSDTGTIHLNLTDHEADLWGCDINAEGDVIIATYSDGHLALWDTETGKKLQSWQAHEAGAISCAISADAGIAVSASKDKTLKVWNVQTSMEFSTLAGHQRTVTSCDIDAAGVLIVSSSNDGTLKIWDAKSGNLRFTLTIHLLKKGIDRLTFLSERDINFSCAISADGRLVAGTSSTGTVTIWDTETGTEQISLFSDKRGVNGCAFNADASILVAALNNSTLKAWDTSTGEELLTMVGHERVVNNCAINADGSIIVSASDDKTIKIWDGQSQNSGMSAITYTGAAKSCAISADGQLVVSTMADKTVKVWDVETAEALYTLKGHRRNAEGCAISADGSTIVSASQDQSLIIWDTKNGQKQRKLTGHTWTIHGCALNSDASMLVSASDDKTIKVWDVATGEERFSLLDHTRTVNDCAVDATGTVIVSASGDKTLKVWDAKIGTKRSTLKGHTAWVNGCAISANGKIIVSASYDKSLKVWDANSGAESHTLKGHTAGVTACAITADGSIVVSVARDKSIKIWQTQTGECLTTLFVNEALVDCDCSADGSHIIAVGNSGIYFLKLEQG